MSARNLPAARRGGKYVPTLTPVLNVDDATLLNAFWSIQGDLVEVCVAIDLDPTATGRWDVRCELPFGLDIQAAGDIVGSGGVFDSGGFATTVLGDPTTNQAVITGDHGAATAKDVTAVFSYRIP